MCPQPLGATLRASLGTHSLPSNISLRTHWQRPRVTHTAASRAPPVTPGVASPGSSEASQTVEAVPRFPAQPGPGRPVSGRHLSPLWISFPRSACPVILSLSFRPGTATLPRKPETSAGRQGVARTWKAPLESLPTTRRHWGLAAASRTRREPSSQPCRAVPKQLEFFHTAERHCLFLCHLIDTKSP